MRLSRKIFSQEEVIEIIQKCGLPMTRPTFIKWRRKGLLPVADESIPRGRRGVFFWYTPKTISRICWLIAKKKKIELTQEEIDTALIYVAKGGK